MTKYINIDEILMDFVGGYESFDEVPNAKEEAKQQLYDLISKKIIGEDEPRSNYAFGNVCEAAWQQANWLRQEQRQKLKELFND